MGFDIERTGIPEERAALRAKYARFAYVAPHDRLPKRPAAKVERPEPVRHPEPPPPVPVVSTTPDKPTIRAVQIAFLEAYYEAGGRTKEEAVYTMNNLCGQPRSFDVSHPRHVCMALVREIAKAHFPAIGKAFGGKDHTVAMFACKRAPDHIAANPILATVCAVVRARFGAEQ